jgi:acyl-CoA thioester hydrolase
MPQSETPALDAFTQAYPVHITQKVQWGEMDALQHVNNTVYFRYFENVRVEFMELTGINALIARENCGPILGHTQCKYLLPLTWPDTITIGTRISAIRDKRFTMEYAVFSHKHQRIVAEGSGEAIYVNYAAGKTVPIPESIRTAISQWLAAESGDD